MWALNDSDKTQRDNLQHVFFIVISRWRWIAQQKSAFPILYIALTCTSFQWLKRNFKFQELENTYVHVAIDVALNFSAKTFNLFGAAK